MSEKAPEIDGDRKRAPLDTSPILREALNAPQAAKRAPILEPQFLMQPCFYPQPVYLPMSQTGQFALPYLQKGDEGEPRRDRDAPTTPSLKEYTILLKNLNVLSAHRYNLEKQLEAEKFKNKQLCHDLSVSRVVIATKTEQIAELSEKLAMEVEKHKETMKLFKENARKMSKFVKRLERNVEDIRTYHRSKFDDWEFLEDDN